MVGPMCSRAAVALSRASDADAERRELLDGHEVVRELRSRVARLARSGWT